MHETSFDVGIHSKVIKCNGWDTTSRDFIYTLAEHTQVHLDLSEGIVASDAMKQTT